MMLKNTSIERCMMITMITIKSGSEIIGDHARDLVGINAGASALRMIVPTPSWPQVSSGNIEEDTTRIKFR
jgi:hypothetical protein